jgi:hypothetical protein
VTAKLNPNPFSWPQTLFALLPAFAALFAPVDVLDRSALARTIVDPWVGLIPRMTHGVSESAWPQVHLLSNALVLWCLPATALWFHLRFWRQRRLWLQKLIDVRFEPTTISVLAAPIVTFVVCALFVFSGLILPGDPSFAEGFSTRSRVGLALLNGLGVCWSVALLAGWIPTSVWAHSELKQLWRSK